MPYIKPERRPIFDTMIDGLIKQLRGSFVPGSIPHYDRGLVRKVVTNIVVYSITIFPPPCELDPTLTGIIRDLGKRVGCRGDVNYILCRVVLESMKPASGWSYHTLSDTISVLETAVDLAYNEIESDLNLPGEDEAMNDVASICYDAAGEIYRRLLAPYEDTAILKNGDMACFANEDFAYIPPLDISQAEMAGGCGCTPLSGCQGGCKDNPGPCGPAPLATPIGDVFTQEQYDAVEQERDEWSDENIESAMKPLLKDQYRDPSQLPPADFPRTVRTVSNEEVDRAARKEG